MPQDMFCSIYGIKDHSKGLRENYKGWNGLEVKTKKDRAKSIDQ